MKPVAWCVQVETLEMLSHMIPQMIWVGTSKLQHHCITHSAFLASHAPGVAAMLAGVSDQRSFVLHDIIVICQQQSTHMGNRT